MNSSRFKGALALVALAALTACGGGGSASSPPVVTVAGTASKGLMANADVAVYAVGVDGKLAAVPLATTTTDSAGKYQLKFDAVKGQPFVIKVSAKSDGTTTHLDEVTGTAQALPNGFSMRALLLPESDGPVSTSVSVTPFSEMAVSAASRASGGITAGNAKQASSTIEQLLGFNPTAVSVVSAKDPAATPEQQKMAVMLTAVSQMASNGDMGCATATNKAQCVVEALSSSSSTASMALTGGASSALQAATQAVLNKPELVGAVLVSTLSNIVTNLGCKDDACKVGSTPVAPDPKAAAITSAKMLFTQIKTDLTSMFSQDGIKANSVGYVNQEAFKFKTAMTGIQAPIEMAVKDVGAMLLGLQLYKDFKSGLTTQPYNNALYGETMTVGVPASVIQGVGCTLYQNIETTVVATNVDNAKFIGCGARFYVTRESFGTGYVQTQWRHGFTIAPQADGSFTYTSRARKRIESCVTGGACTTTANDPLQPDVAAFTGKMTPAMKDGAVTGLAIQGELPAAFRSGRNTLVNYKSAVDLVATQALTAGDVTAVTLNGSITGYKSATTQESKLSIQDGSISQANGAEFTVVWNTGAAEFEGGLALKGITADKSGTGKAPTQLALKGMLRNIAGGVSTEFLSGSFSASVTGYGGFDATQPASASNQFMTNMEFHGAVTAPSRPQLKLNLGAGMMNDGADTPLPFTLQYSTLVGGTPRSVVTLTGMPGAPAAFKLAEALSSLSMSWNDGASQADVVFGNPAVKIGTVQQNGILTFIDGSSMSMDLGL